MRGILEVDVAALAAALPQVKWLPAGDPGTYAMVEAKDFPPALAAAADSVIDAVAPLYPGRRRGMACLSCLVPGQYIPQHEDRHDGRCRVRLHAPIITNPGAIFVSGTWAVHMAAGHVYEIDPSVTHCVANGGETDRVHLFWNFRE